VGTSGSDALELAATAALNDAHAELYDCPPFAAHARADGGAILVVARCSAARSPAPGRSQAAAVAHLQHQVSASVYLRTGEMLRPCGRSSDRDRGLLVLAFERVPADALDAWRGSGPREPLAGAS
jgi:hypothetical protein